jgi:hypothetical protein
LDRDDPAQLGIWGVRANTLHRGDKEFEAIIGVDLRARRASVVRSGNVLYIYFFCNLYDFKMLNNLHLLLYWYFAPSVTKPFERTAHPGNILGEETRQLDPLVGQPVQ